MMAGDPNVKQPTKALDDEDYIVRHEDNMDELVPWCGIGCMSCFGYFEFPACVGLRLAGDVLCCTIE